MGLIAAVVVYMNTKKTGKVAQYIWVHKIYRGASANIIKMGLPWMNSSTTNLPFELLKFYSP